MDNKRLHCKMSLRLYFEEKAFGPGMAELLEEIEREGSLQKAAQSMDMAYSKAWKMLKHSEKAWGFPLTNRAAGGKDGGGSSLTPQARRLMKAYGEFRAEAGRAVDKLFEEYFGEEKVEALRESGDCEAETPEVSLPLSHGGRKENSHGEE